MTAVFPVLLDACVLYPMYLRDTLLWCAESGLYRVHWSQQILNEVTRNLVGNNLISPPKAAYLEHQMKEAFPDAMVEVPPELIKAMPNDPKDRHVLAAAVVANAQVIVTSNLQDFQEDALAPFGIEELVVSSEGKTACKRWNSDDWGGYERVLPPEILHQIGKDGTQRLERTNGIVRQQTGRWHRRQNKFGKLWEQTKVTTRLVVSYFNGSAELAERLDLAA